jgi:hypothetical protein
VRRSAIALRTPADAFVANLATKCAAAAARSPDPVPTAALSKPSTMRQPVALQSARRPDRWSPMLIPPAQAARLGCSAVPRALPLRRPARDLA